MLAVLTFFISSLSFLFFLLFLFLFPVESTSVAICCFCGGTEHMGRGRHAHRSHAEVNCCPRPHYCFCIFFNSFFSLLPFIFSFSLLLPFFLFSFLPPSLFSLLASWPARTRRILQENQLLLSRSPSDLYIFSFPPYLSLSSSYSISVFLPPPLLPSSPLV